MPRRLVPLILVLAALAPRAARATEIDPPPPLGDDIGRLDGRVTLARWLALPRPDAPGALVGAASLEDVRRPLVVGVDGAPALISPAAHATSLAPLPLEIGAVPTSDEGIVTVGPLLDLDGGVGGATWLRGAVAGSTRAAGVATRFDVRPADLNPIALGGDVLDDLTARVVRTPEPTTLALFALGAAMLAYVVHRRR